jgi:hypothetical protein
VGEEASTVGCPFFNVLVGPNVGSTLWAGHCERGNSKGPLMLGPFLWTGFAIYIELALRACIIISSKLAKC